MAYFVPDAYSVQWVYYPDETRSAQKKIGKTTRTTKKKIVKKLGLSYSPICHFCMGNGHAVLEELWHWKAANSVRVAPGSEVRVVKFPYESSLYHELVIPSPDHKLDLKDLPVEQMAAVMSAVQARSNDLKQLGNVIYYGNKGEIAGQQIEHPHSHLLVLPRQVCLDAMSLQPVANIVEETDRCVSYCPSFSQWPYEVWVTAKRAKKSGLLNPNTQAFSSLGPEQLMDISHVFQRTLQRVEKLLPDIPYSYYVHLQEPWYIRIMPRLAFRGGFELATGLVINSVPPERAAEALRLI